MKRCTCLVAVAFAALTWSTPRSADAFCGFYVGGAGADLFNNATQVVMMRHGTRTVLSMQNAYQGPTKDFAMVVPVPVVLKKEDVKTLDAKVFKRVDRLAAPRLVEYWEKDPCAPEIRYKSVQKSGGMDPTAVEGSPGGVKVLAKFAVGEYQIVILSAKDSTGLEKWLTDAKYNIPKGAAKYLKPYVQDGSKFFVAKVDAKKVKFKDGRAMLSPLRVAYDSKEFKLPIRLGMMNANGAQDLIVHILAKGQRYDVANYKNVTIPSNLSVVNDVRKKFGEFYAALFDATLKNNPGAVVTEYSWDASSCDPCPEPPLRPQEIATLGGDVLGTKNNYGFVLTRLHARYTKDGIKDDLVFRKAKPIVGGRQRMRRVNNKAELEQGAAPGSMNNFQGRYIIRHRWTGAVKCDKPIYGRWGGPDGRKSPKAPAPAVDLAFAPRGKISLTKMVAQNVPEIAVKGSGVSVPLSGSKGMAKSGGNAGGGATKGPAGKGSEASKKKKKGCGCAATDNGGAAGGLLLLLGVGLVLARRRRIARS